MALFVDPEYDEVEFFVVGRSTAGLHDVDLTCYETFYDSSPLKVETGTESLKECGSSGMDGLAVFERNIANTNRYCAIVPDIDYMSPDINEDMFDVVTLYDIVKGELFGNIDQKDLTVLEETCFMCPADVPLVDLQQVPMLLGNINGRNMDSTADSIQPRSQPSSPVGAQSKSEPAGNRSAVTMSPPAPASESDSEDARVPSSCFSDVLPYGWYHIEE